MSRDFANDELLPALTVPAQAVPKESLTIHDSPMPATRAEVFGPASLSNLGPGFDAIGLCIRGRGDVVEARLDDAPGVHIEHVEGGRVQLPREANRNTASVAAQAVLDLLGSTHGVVLRIRKEVTSGSGIGSSSASAVAGAWAVNALHGLPLTKEELVEAVLAGEAIASGGFHGDNVLPALFGGLVLVSASDPRRYRRIGLPKPLPIALLLPELQILTKQARAMLPEQVGLRDAVHNASELAFLVDAFRCGDWEAVGRGIMADRLVEPVRARMVPCYDAVRAAALEGGALGCALSGSGPAMFAIAATPETAAQALDAMLDACRREGIDARGCVTQADDEGVCVR